MSINPYRLLQGKGKWLLGLAGIVGLLTIAQAGSAAPKFAPTATASSTSIPLSARVDGTEGAVKGLQAATSELQGRPVSAIPTTLQGNNAPVSGLTITSSDVQPLNKAFRTSQRVGVSGTNFGSVLSNNRGLADQSTLVPGTGKDHIRVVVISLRHAQTAPLSQRPAVTTAIGAPISPAPISARDALLVAILLVVIALAVVTRRAWSGRKFAHGMVARWPVTIVAAVAIAFSMYSWAKAADMPQLILMSGQTYFSPNGDTQEDTATVYYCLTQPANVDVRITNSSGGTVRLLESGVSHGGGDCNSYWNNWVEWDGRNDDGQVVPDAVYTARLAAHNANGDSSELAVQLGVDTRIPGALTKPAPGDTLSGNVDCVKSPFFRHFVSTQPQLVATPQTVPAAF